MSQPHNDYLADRVDAGQSRHTCHPTTGTPARHRPTATRRDRPSAPLHTRIRSGQPPPSLSTYSAKDRPLPTLQWTDTDYPATSA